MLRPSVPSALITLYSPKVIAEMSESGNNPKNRSDGPRNWHIGVVNKLTVLLDLLPLYLEAKKWSAPVMSLVP